jgi:hypothetical protein
MRAVVLKEGGKREAASVRGIVVGAVIVHRPIHELEISIRAKGVEVKEIGQAEFSEAELQPALW